MSVEGGGGGGGGGRSGLLIDTTLREARRPAARVRPISAAATLLHQMPANPVRVTSCVMRVRVCARALRPPGARKKALFA
jgi:hypothetical protein